MPAPTAGWAATRLDRITVSSPSGFVWVDATRAHTASFRKKFARTFPAVTDPGVVLDLAAKGQAVATGYAKAGRTYNGTYTVLAPPEISGYGSVAKATESLAWQIQDGWPTREPMQVGTVIISGREVGVIRWTPAGTSGFTYFVVADGSDYYAVMVWRYRATAEQLGLAIATAVHGR